MTTVPGVTVGMALPDMVFAVTRTTLAKDVAGTRDFYPIHHDHEFAQANGVRDVFLNTMWYQGLLGRYATDWGGPESFLRTLAFDMRSHAFPGDTLTTRGIVTRVAGTEDLPVVDIDLTIENQDGTQVVHGQLAVELVHGPICS